MHIGLRRWLLQRHRLQGLWGKGIAIKISAFQCKKIAFLNFTGYRYWQSRAWEKVEVMCPCRKGPYGPSLFLLLCIFFLAPASLKLFPPRSPSKPSAQPHHGTPETKASSAFLGLCTCVRLGQPEQPVAPGSTFDNSWAIVDECSYTVTILYIFCIAIAEIFDISFAVVFFEKPWNLLPSGISIYPSCLCNRLTFFVEDEFLEYVTPEWVEVVVFRITQSSWSHGSKHLVPIRSRYQPCCTNRSRLASMILQDLAQRRCHWVHLPYPCSLLCPFKVGLDITLGSGCFCNVKYCRSKDKFFCLWLPHLVK